MNSKRIHFLNFFMNQCNLFEINLKEFFCGSSKRILYKYILSFLMEFLSVFEKRFRIDDIKENYFQAFKNLLKTEMKQKEQFHNSEINKILLGFSVLSGIVPLTLEVS